MPSPRGPASRLMLALVQHLLRLADQLAAYDKEIARLFQAHADQPIFSGLPGAGKRLAPRLLAEWGDDRSRYASAASVQAPGGTSPVPFESGKHTSVRASACLYQTLAQCALPICSGCGRFRDPGPKPAITASARKAKRTAWRCAPRANVWVRIIYARLSQARALPSGYLPRSPASS
jgi:transposase